MKGQTKTLSLKAAYVFGAENKLGREINEIKNMEVRTGVPYPSTLRRGYIVNLFEKKELFKKFKTKHWNRGNTKSGDAETRRFRRTVEQYESLKEEISRSKSQLLAVLIKCDPIGIESGAFIHVRERILKSSKVVVGAEAFVWFSETNGGQGLSMKGVISKVESLGKKSTISVKIANSRPLKSLRIRDIKPFRHADQSTLRGSLAYKALWSFA